MTPTFWHGTSAVHKRRILSSGLEPGSFLTVNEEDAAMYAIRAACLEARERGVYITKGVRGALLLELAVDLDLVEIDPSHWGQFTAPNGVPADCITASTEFDPRPYLRPGAVRHLWTPRPARQRVAPG